MNDFLAQTSGIIAYDFLFCQGGAERVTLNMARGIGNADICVAFRNYSAYPDKVLEDIRCRSLCRSPGLQFRGWRTLSGIHSFRHRAGFLAEYDWAIFSGSNAPVGVHHRPKEGNLYYCHTIPRFAYDLRDWYLASTPYWQRPALRMLTRYVRGEYENALQRMNKLIANSENVKKRLKTHLGVEAEVVHPPCNIDGYQWRGQKDFYLSTARLEPYKRVDRIIEAFRKFPQKKLVIASGGSDGTRLRRLAEGAANIYFTGWVSEEELKKMVGTAIATIYVPKDEDFGMSPVESMAAGKPVIGNAEGGLLETILPYETGILTASDPSPDDIAEAVRVLTPDKACSMRFACEQRAASFSRDRFLNNIKQKVMDIAR